MKTPLVVKIHSPRILLAREGVGKAFISIEHMDQMFATISYVNLPLWVSADTMRVRQLSLSTVAKLRDERSSANAKLLDSVVTYNHRHTRGHL